MNIGIIKEKKMSLSLSTNEATVITQFVYGLDPRGRESVWEVKDSSTIIHKISISSIYDIDFMEHLLKSIKGRFAHVYTNIDFDNEDDIDTLTNALTDYEKDWAESYYNCIWEEYFMEHGGTLTTGYEINDKTLFYDLLEDRDVLEVIIDKGDVLVADERRSIVDAWFHFTNIMEEVELTCVANKAVDVAKAAAETAEGAAADAKALPPLPPMGVYVYDPLKMAQELKIRYDRELGL